MKIAYIAVKGIPMSGGIEKYTELMSTHLSKMGHDVTVYTTRHYGNTSGNYGNFTIRTVPSIRNRFLEKITLVFCASIDQLFHDYDIVHYHALGPSIFAFMAKMQKKKVVIQSHGIEYQRAKWGRFAVFVLKTFERLSYNMGDALTVVSKPLQQHFLDTYGKQSFFIPTAVDLPDFTQDHNDLLAKYHVKSNGYYLFIARIVEEKGAHYLIEAFKKLSTDKKLLIAGKIDKKNVYHQKLISLAENDSRIVFVGEVLGIDKDALFKGAFAFCLPSELEGMSVALLEAMSYKKCCIVSDIPENMDIAEGHTFLFHNKDVNSLLNVMQQVENASQDTLKKCGNDAFRYVEKEHSFKTIAKQMEQLYQSL